MPCARPTTPAPSMGGAGASLSLFDLEARRRRAVLARLIRWFERQARPLPWRRSRSPYRVTVSEFMLQQTRVETVERYYGPFLRRFPSWRALAAADLSEVLKAWEGLGYYARARRLHALAREVVARHGGQLPSDRVVLDRLPGMGPYVAAAVGSLAFGLPTAAVDGNVRRVVSRLAGSDLSPGDCRRRLEPLVSRRDPGRFNEAWMELGATVCQSRRPRCGVCPLRSVCRSFLWGDPTAVPRPRCRGPRPHWVVGAAVTLDVRGRILITRRPDESMLGGLWEFPGGKVEPGETLPECIRRELIEELGIEVEVGPEVTRVRHQYSHFGITLHAHVCRPVRGRARPRRCAAVAWIRLEEAASRAFSRADLHVLAAVREQYPRLRPWAAGLHRIERTSRGRI